MRLVLLVSLAVLCGCDPVLSKETVKVVQLPADPQEGPALAAVQTKDGTIFAAPSNGGFLSLAPDAGAWEPVSGPVMKRFLRDFKDGSSFAEGSGDTGVFEGSRAGFSLVSLPELPTAAFTATGKFSSVRARDAAGTWWASSAPSFGAFDGRQFLAHLEPSAPTQWVVEEIPLANAAQTVPAASPAITSDARFFFRPPASGVWEVDVANKVMVERVSCEHELFRPSGTGAMACQEDTWVFAGLGGELFLLNPNRELWRIGPRETTPKLVVKGNLPSLDAQSGRSQGAPSTWVDPKGRVWLAFRWGSNGKDDVSYLYVAEPAKKDAWIFLSKTLPRAVVLLGDGETPLISSTSQDLGLLLFRVQL